MQALVYIKSNDAWDFDSVISHLRRNRTALTNLAKEVLQKGEQANIHYPMTYTSSDIFVAIRFANEIDRGIVAFLTERNEEQSAYFIVDAKELEEY